MYLENAHANADLSQRISGITEAMEKKERDFHRMADARLKKANEQKTLADFIEQKGSSLLQPAFHRDKRKGTINENKNAIYGQEQQMIDGLDTNLEEQKKLAEKRQRIKEENYKKKQEEQLQMHPSFRHRLRLFEAE